MASTVTEGQSASFTIAASGDGVLTYLWRRNGAVIAGATSATYSFTATLADNGSQFQAEVSNRAGSVSSQTVVLTVQPLPAAPSITTAPASTAVSVGQAAAFSVVASGTAPISYQWQRDGVPIAGATGASYSLASAALTDNDAQFRVIVSNAGGSSTSSAATLTVLPSVTAPVITAAPQALSVREGGTATFGVAASGTAPFTYQWLRNGTPVAGASAATYTTPALLLADSGSQWRVVVSNSAGSITSTAVALTVTAVPAAVSTPPQAVGVIAGQTATFTVVATGSAPLTYQWRRNGSAIAGATSASYTTPATVLADDGALYSVVVDNAAAQPATSAGARLSVAAAVVAPSFTTAPAGLTVTEGQPVTFTAAAAGTAPIAYQWRRNGVDIAGATAATYAMAAAALADNGALISVRASNAAGQTTSTEVLLTVNAATSVLAGRSWTAGQLLEANDQPVIARAQAIDDQGRAMVVFLKSDGTRNVLYATRANTGTAPSTPAWSTPTVIDLQAGGVLTNNMTASNAQFGLHMAPAGNAVAYWVSTANCSASTYFTSGTCRYLFAARYLAASAAWEEPVLVGDVPNDFAPAMAINDRGDLVGRVPGWVRFGATSYTGHVAVIWRAAGASAASGFGRRTFSDVQLTGTNWMSLDNSGNLLVAAQAVQNATTDIVAYRGTLSGGFGAQQVLDQRGSAATLRIVESGLNGQQVVVWSQNNGTQDSIYAATATSPGAAFAVQELGPGDTVGGLILTVDDTGNALLMNRYAGWRVRWTAGAWQAAETLPAGTPNSTSFACSHTRNGNFLCVNNNSGFDRATSMWVTYDAARNVLIQPPDTTNPGSGFVLRMNTTDARVGLSAPELSINGTAVVTMQNGYDTLPTPSAPAGDSRAIANLWSSVLH